MRTLFVFFILSLLATSCQKELFPPEETPDYVKVASDTIMIRAFYGHQGLTPPNVGTVIFPMAGYEVPDSNKLAFMSAFTGRNGYGDSAGAIKKNAINNYNGEFYNVDVNAVPNARITVVPINHPRPDYNTVSTDSSFVYTKYFKQPRNISISVSLINGMWEHRDTTARGKITVYQMNPLLLTNIESVETGLATLGGVQKLTNGISEFYMAFVNQRGIIIQLGKAGGKAIYWHPVLYPK